MDALAHAASEHPDAPALLTGGRTITYAELDAAASGVAHSIAATGALADHAIGFWGDRNPETAAAVWGIPRAGSAAVPVDPRIPPALAMDTTRAVGVRGLWTPPSGGFERLVERGTAQRYEGVGEYVVLTSGSEGRPKGVRLTRQNVAASVAASAARLGHGRGDGWLCVLPLFHVSGLSILWRQAAAAAPVHLHSSFEAAAAAAALADVAFASFVPTMLRRVLEAGGAGHDGLRAVLVGGAASDPALLEEARRAGMPAVPTYGMTETCSQIATPDPTAPLDGTVGYPLDGAEIEIGATGRIRVRGPMVTPGYVGESREDGWFETGDLGEIDGSGRLRVLGRADSVIVTGGENVHPESVESALRSHHEVRDVRVRGEVDPEWGEVIVAEVETSVDVARLVALADRLPPHMRPRRWEIVDRIDDKLG